MKCVFLFNIHSNTSSFWLFNLCVYIYIYIYIYNAVLWEQDDVLNRLLLIYFSELYLITFIVIMVFIIGVTIPKKCGIFLLLVRYV